MVKDSEMQDKFWQTLTEVCDNEELRKEMAENIRFFAKPNATEEIVNQVMKFLNQ